MTQPIKQWLLSAACALAVCLPLGSQAQMPFFNRMMQNAEPTSSAPTCRDNNDGTFTARDGTVWQKCLFGTRFENGRCVGSAKAISWIDAVVAAKEDRFLGQNDWVVPSFELYKNNFFDGKCNVAGSYIRSAGDVAKQFRMIGLEDGPYWTTEMGRNHDTAVVTTLGLEGYDVSSIGASSLKGNIRYNDIKVAFVRNVSEGALKSFSAAQVKVSSHNQRRQQEEVEYKSKIEAEERQLNDAINNKNPQTMYLSAGSYERNGEGYKAKQIYEAIISRFPNSSWAVKANDQLNAAMRSNEAESSARQRQYDAQRASREAESTSKSQCSFRISKCEETCSNLNGAAWRRCSSGCQSLCNQF